MSKKTKIILIISLTLVPAAFFAFIFLSSKGIHTIAPLSNIPSTKEEMPRAEGAEKDKVILINDAPGETNVYDFMNKLRSEGKINFTEKNYAGMGKFIDSINGIKNNGNQNWIYYVNDKKAEIGVSKNKIRQGDIVSWKYENNY